MAISYDEYINKNKKKKKKEEPKVVLGYSNNQNNVNNTTSNVDTETLIKNYLTEQQERKKKEAAKKTNNIDKLQYTTLLGYNDRNNVISRNLLGQSNKTTAKEDDIAPTKVSFTPVKKENEPKREPIKLSPTAGQVTEEGYTDTGTTYGRYRYKNYAERKDYKIYEKEGKYYYYDEKRKVYTPVDQAEMTTKELDEKDYKEAVKNGYTGSKKKISLEDQIKLDTANLTAEEYEEYEKDLERQQADKEEQQKRDNRVRKGGAGIKGAIEEVKTYYNNAAENIDNEVIEPIRDAGDNYEYGKMSEELGLEAYKKMMGQKNNYDEMRAEYEKYVKFNEDIVTNSNYLDQSIQMIPNQIGGLKAGLEAGGIGGVIGAVGGGIIGAVTSKTPAGAIAGAKTGAKALGGAAYVGGQAQYTYKLEAGIQYQTLIDMGVPEDIAKKEAQDTGTFNALIEAGESILDLVSMGGLSKLKGALTKKLIAEYGEETVKEWILKTTVKNALSEGVEETVQEGGSIYNEKQALEQAGIERDDSGDLERLKESFIAGAFSGGLMGGATSITAGTVKAGSNIIRENEIKENVKQQIDNYEQETGTTLTDEERETLIEITTQDIQNIISYGGTQKSDISGSDIAPVGNTSVQTAATTDETALRSQNYVYEASDTDSTYRRNLNEDATKYANNTTRTHEFVNTLANVSEASGLDIRLTNNTSPEMTQRKEAMINSYAKRNNVSVQEASERLKNIVIDGYNVNDQITINVNSPKALKRLVGHEITHSLEKTGEYKNNLQKLAIEYAKSKNDYKSRLDRLMDLYAGQNADINKELTADIIGDYLFTDQKFVDSIYKKDRNLFQRIYDEIKHLIKMATAGSKEARELEKLKHSFEKAMRENKEMRNESSNTTTQESKSNSLVEAESDTQEKEDSVQKTEKTETSNVTESVETETKTEDKTVSKIEENVEEYSLSDVDSEGNKLSEEQIEFFKKSVVRDENGNLIVVYHTMTNEGTQFNEFNPVGTGGYRFGDQVVIYFTDSKEMSGSYAGFDKYKMADTQKITSLAEARQLVESMTDGEVKIKKQGDKYQLTGDKNKVKAYEEAKAVYDTINATDKDFMYQLLAHSGMNTTSRTEQVNDFFKVIKGYQELNLGLEYIDINLSEDAKDYFAGMIGHDFKVPMEVYKTYDNETQLLRNIKVDLNYLVDGESKFQYEGYLNITNPYIVEANGGNWDEISQEFSENIKIRFESLTAEERESLIKLSSQGKLATRPVLEIAYTHEDTETGFSYYGTKYSSEDAKNLASAYVKLRDGAGMKPTYDSIYSVAEQRFKKMWIESASVVDFSTNDIVKRVIEDNKHGAKYDGVIIREVTDYGLGRPEEAEPNDVYVVFNSNQFKAKDNKNPTEDSDIRYSLSMAEKGTVVDENNKPIQFYRYQKSGTQLSDDYDYSDSLSSHNTGFGIALRSDDLYTKGKNESEIIKTTISSDRGFLTNSDNVIGQDQVNKINEVYEKYIPDGFTLLDGNVTEEKLIASINMASEQIAYINDNKTGKEAFNEFYNAIRKDGYITTDENGVKTAVVLSTKQLDFMNEDIRYSLSEVDNQGNELKPAVQKRFENSKARDENGQLKVLYHGSPSGEFTVFDKNLASPEGDWGAGFYLTDNEYDVESNYADGGGDFDNKVSRLAEQIEQEEDISYDEAKEKAREQLYKGYYRIDAYVNVENPAIVGKTYLFDNDRYSGEYDINDYEDTDDYYSDVEELVSADIDNVIWNIEREYDLYNGTDEIRNLLWEAFADGGMEIQRLKSRLNEMYLEADEGLVGNDIARIIIESQGYDGIIDNTVSMKFPGMHLEEGTTHYIVFKPNQIKNITNENPTNEADINMSLSRTDDVAPVGENDIFGKDIEVQEQVKEAIAPLQEQIETLTKTISDLQENMAPASFDLVEEQRAETQRTMTDEDAPLTDEGTFSFLDDEVKVKKKNEIIKEIQSDFNIKQSEARELYNKIESIPEVTIDDVYTELENYRKVKFKEQDDYVKSIQDYIKGTRLDISEIKKQIPDYGNVYRMSNMGKGLILGNSGQSIDSFYQELNELFPNEFPSDVMAEADQLELISQAMFKEKEFTYTDVLDDDELQILAERIYADIGNHDRYRHTQSGLYFLNKEVKNMTPPGETDVENASNTEQMEENVSLDEELNELDAQKGPSITKNPFDEVLDKFLEGKRTQKIAAVTPKVEKSKYRNAVDTAQRLFVNEMVESDNLAKETGNLNIKYTGDMLNNVAGEIEGEIYTAQTDNNGHQIGKSLSALFSEARKTGLYDAFNDYLEQYSNIDRHAQGKGSVVPLADSQRLVRHYEKTYPEFKQWGKGVWQYGANIRNNLIDAGIINEEFAETLGTMYPHYVPYMENREMSNYNPDLGEIKPKGVIKRAVGGADNLLPIEDALTKYTFASKKAVRQNQFYQEIVSTLDSKAEVGADVRNDAVDLEDTLYRDETGNYLTAYFDGERLSVRISDDLYTGLKNDLEGQIRGLEEKFALITDPVQKLSEIRRNLLTSWNPMFIIKNPIMDVQDALFNSKHTKDFMKNYPGAFVELGQAKSETAKQFLTLYGSGNVMGEYSSDGTVKNRNFLKGIQKANNIMELAPRYAEFKASLENGATLEEAMYNAREVTTNFGRGGVITKALNRNGFTFLNVSVQGFDKFIRNFSGENGAKGVAGALLKASVLGVIPAIFNELAFGSGDEEDEDYNALPDYIKDNYYLIKTGDGEFIRIPKGRMLSVFGSAARRTIEYMQGEEDAFDGFLKNANSQIGVSNPLDSNILTPLFQAFGSENGEAWYGGDLVPTRLQGKAPREQYDSSTDKFSIWLGDKLGISPYKINYVIDQYSGGVGDIFLPFITEESTSDAEGLELALAPIKDQFTANSTFDNKYAGDIYDLSDKMDKMPSSVKETDEYKIQDAYLYSVTSEMGKLYAERRKVQEDKTLSKKEKYEKVQKIQKQINDLAKEGLDNYQNINSTKNYAIVGGREFNKYKTESGEERWGAVREEELEALNSYGLDIMEKSSYFNAKTYISEAQEKYKNTEDYTQKKRDIISVIKSTLLTDEAKAYLYDKYYGNTDALNTVVSLGIDFDKYLDFEYQNFEADKNSAGKSISGSKKAKVFAYINSMDLSFEEKVVLTKLQYNSYDEYNGEVINYINNSALTYEQRVNILKKLGFTVDEYGNIYW